MSNRVPRISEHQKEQPDSPGRWWFQGRCTLGLTVTSIQNRPFEIVQEGGELLTLVPETGMPFEESCELIGWWMSEEDMASLN